MSIQAQSDASGRMFHGKAIDQQQKQFSADIMWWRRTNVDSCLAGGATQITVALHVLQSSNVTQSSNVAELEILRSA